jgi:hypothetical protein
MPQKPLCSEYIYIYIHCSSGLMLSCVLNCMGGYEAPLLCVTSTCAVLVTVQIQMDPLQIPSSSPPLSRVVSITINLYFFFNFSNRSSRSRALTRIPQHLRLSAHYRYPWAVVSLDGARTPLEIYEKKKAS